jgi:DNA-binding FadR family transcriptional regulator
MSNNSRSVDGRRLYEQVADRIRALINAGDLTEGARLPPERDLALQLGVSRSSLREALIALEIYGRIEIRSGSGIYVSASRGDASLFYLGESPADLLQARVVLESSVANLAAARASKPGLERIEAALEDMREDLADGASPVEADRRFHLSIAEQSGNSVLVGMVSTLLDGRHSPISRMSVRTETPHSWQSALEEHDAILRALKSRNPQAAAAAMCHHLQASHGRWIGEPNDLWIAAAMV